MPKVSEKKPIKVSKASVKPEKKPLKAEKAVVKKTVVKKEKEAIVVESKDDKVLKADELGMG
jgi:hypothetical protein